MHHITGWPDRDPAGPWGAYTDFIAPRYGLAAIAAAIYERQRSGRGQHVDLGQVEAGIHFAEPLLLDYLVNGRVAGGPGHDSLTSCPHGVYRTAGTERYVAIEVESAAQWRALRAVAALDAYADARFDRASERLRERAGIEAAMSDWCADQDPWALTERLESAGVPAAVVQRPSDLYRDAQLAHRGFFVTLDHSVMGADPVRRAGHALLRDAGRVTQGGPRRWAKTRTMCSSSCSACLASGSPSTRRPGC